MRNKIRYAKLRVESKRRLKRVLDDAFDQSLRRHLDAITPRLYVDMRTISSFELGLRFKAALRDELYERRRDDRRRTSAGKMNEKT